MTAPVRRLLPVVSPSAAPSRTTGDRLELLTALLNAPKFDTAFRTDVIDLPGDHSFYGWECGVPECDRALNPGSEFCHVHLREWQRYRSDGHSVVEFLRTARPLKAKSWKTPPPCLICPHIPAHSRDQLCYLHATRWRQTRSKVRIETGAEPDFAEWLDGQPPLPSFGQCQVVACPEEAGHALGLCRRHRTLYDRAGRPGGARPPHNWGRMATEWHKPVVVQYQDKAAFRRWCLTAGPIMRSHGKLSLLGLKPLVKAEIQWSMFHHTQVPAQGGNWPLPWIQHLAEHCRVTKANSLADLDLDSCNHRIRLIGTAMVNHLRLVYFSREDTKDAGFIETDHFGVRFPHSGSRIDLSRITQRWLRDLLWDFMAVRLSGKPPRSRSAFDQLRRGCVELSAHLEAFTPGGGHDPTALTSSHATDFVTDQRHRARHRLKSLGIHRPQGRDKAGEPSIVTAGTVSTVFKGSRRVLREALETGAAEKIGLDRGFIVTMPSDKTPSRRRSPFPDDVARALAHPANLANLETFDVNDRGLRDAWEALVLVGRRCGEVLNVRLECIGRLNGLPMFWHDQTKVGNYDEAIRIPERLYQRIERRQTVTVARFVQRYGRPPTPRERLQIALFPRQNSNRNLLKGVSYQWFHRLFRDWVNTLDIAHCVPHQSRHTLATNLLRNGADLIHVKRYLGQVSERMAEHYVHLANTDPRLEQALQTLWVTGPGSDEPGLILSGSEPMSKEAAEALAIDLTRRSTPADGGFCTFQHVVDGAACPFDLNCHSCENFVMSGADLVYWHRKREQWRIHAEQAPDSATADYFHKIFEPTARAITGLERALEAVGLLDAALALDLRRPQDYFGRVWATAFRAADLAQPPDFEDGDAA
ncbi:tyrosine-type recombinase/integrase [Streptomyces sp. NPDC058268]|uniref:tyrosine-type recombinase/integrase n=1 Tax=Streptomyces sp. NPDC058268 TaxID=3346413 RepID=UPI0036E811F3